MGMPTILSIGGATTGRATPWIVDWMQCPVNISVGATGTSATYAIEYTNDDIGPVTPANALWFTLATGITTALFTSIAFPVRAMTINLLTSTATGIVTATFVQATDPVG